jgi:HEAT repeat protein
VIVQRSTIITALAAAGLVAFGVWLGRASSDKPVQPSAAEREPAPEPGTIPVTIERVPRRAPALATRTPAPAVAADLVHADPKIRRAAVREVEDPKLLLEASRDQDVEVAIVAIETLGKLHADGQVSAKDLAARATDRNSPERVRAFALSALGQVASPEAAAVLVDLLARGDVVERRSAAALLVKQDLALAVPALITALGDDDQWVRSQALDSLKARSRGRDFGTDAAAWRAWWDVESRR